MNNKGGCGGGAGSAQLGGASSINISSSSSATTDLIDAKLEKQQQQQLSGSKHHCPGCGHKLEGSQPDWVGLPAGVKFDPTDQELIEHLEAKVEGKRSNKSHPLIDEFIPTIEGEDGICYTHPEKLPGVTRDGLSRHFFHRPSKAYTTGTRKRRKIQTECDLRGGETRWHKTGKTRPVMLNGKQKGCKKILVLYTNFGKNRKPEKTNWVMHQYHLGQLEEEKEGELVVSKIFYQTQPRQCNWSSERAAAAVAAATSGTTTSAGDGSEPSGGGGGSISSKEVALMGNRADQQQQQHEISMMGGSGVVMASYSAMEMHHQQQLKGHPSDHFGYATAYTTNDQAGVDQGEASSTVTIGRDVAVTAASMSAAVMCEENQQGIPHHQHMPGHHQQDHHHPPVTTYHHMISRPANSISEMISPPSLHQASLILGDHHHDAYHHLPRMIFPTQDNFQHQQQQTQQQQQQQQTHHQQQQQHHHHHKIVGRSSGSGLEEIIMGCTSSSSPADIKEESSMPNPQEAEWLKYSSFWPDNSDDHHG